MFYEKLCVQAVITDQFSCLIFFKSLAVARYQHHMHILNSMFSSGKHTREPINLACSWSLSMV